MPSVFQSLRSLLSLQPLQSLHPYSAEKDLYHILFSVLEEALVRCDVTAETMPDIYTLCHCLEVCAAAAYGRRYPQPPDSNIRCSPILYLSANACPVQEAAKYWLGKLSSSYHSILFTEGCISSTFSQVIQSHIRKVLDKADRFFLQASASGCTSRPTLEFIASGLHRTTLEATHRPARPPSAPVHFNEYMSGLLIALCHCTLATALLWAVMAISNSHSSSTASDFYVDTNSDTYYDAFVDPGELQEHAFVHDTGAMRCLPISINTGVSAILATWSVFIRQRQLKKSWSRNYKPSIQVEASEFKSFQDAHTNRYLSWLTVTEYLPGVLTTNEDRARLRNVITLFSETLWRILTPESHSGHTIPAVVTLLIKTVSLFSSHPVIEDFLPLENELTTRVIPWLEALPRSEMPTTFEEMLIDLKGVVETFQQLLQFQPVRFSPTLSGLVL